VTGESSRQTIHAATPLTGSVAALFIYRHVPVASLPNIVNIGDIAEKFVTLPKIYLFKTNVRNSKERII